MSDDTVAAVPGQQTNDTPAEAAKTSDTAGKATDPSGSHAGKGDLADDIIEDLDSQEDANA